MVIIIAMEVIMDPTIEDLYTVINLVSDKDVDIYREVN